MPFPAPSPSPPSLQPQLRRCWAHGHCEPGWTSRWKAALRVSGLQVPGSSPFHSWRGPHRKNALWLHTSQSSPGDGGGGTTHTQQRPDGGSEESSSSDPPTPAVPRAKQDTPTFWLLHAAGSCGRWCRRDLCAVRDGRKRKRGKKTLFLTLEEGEQSRESPLGPPPFPTPQPQRTRVRELQEAGTVPERGLALLWILSLHLAGTRVEKRQGGPTARRADLAPCTGLGPCGSRWGFPSPHVGYDCSPRTSRAGGGGGFCGKVA